MEPMLSRMCLQSGVVPERKVVADGQAELVKGARVTLASSAKNEKLTIASVERLKTYCLANYYALSQVQLKTLSMLPSMILSCSLLT
jgi:hypothetical protein